ncbi:hypothetical protein ACRALDRAFT_1076683 [Sodiomyces alcalophilus JCM 7366]|uniref:uncharacterized protein n=1 Tax=Sodiomyces alcalophilus JCM 7366 TaxID=591952 RepID=UPI0039B651E7
MTSTASGEAQPREPLTTWQNVKFFLSMAPQLPLVARVTLQHLLGRSEPAKYLDLRSELTVAVLRSIMQPAKPRSISSTQRLVVRDPGVRGRIWVANYAAPAPPEPDVLDALVDAVVGLRDPSSEPVEIPRPTIVPVEAEWTGYRAGATDDARLPRLSERELFEEMQKEVTSPVTILYLHGGAYYVGDPCTHRPVTKKLAKITGGRCYSVRYRLAPQNPFPAALLDALVSYMTLLYPPPDAYHTQVAPEHVVLAGDSAGGNLSLALLQTILELQRQGRRLRWFGVDREVPLPAGVAVCSPWMDITVSSPSWQANEAFDYLPPASKYHQIKYPPCSAWPASPPRRHLYASDSLVAHPLVTLVMARDWTGAPPVYLCTGWELLADEDKFAARMFHSQGVRVVFEEYEAMPHCFAMVLPQSRNARRCFDGWAGFIRDVVEKGADGMESKAVMIKARTSEEVELDFSSLGCDAEKMRDRVLAHVADPVDVPSEIVAKL